MSIRGVGEYRLASYQAGVQAPPAQAPSVALLPGDSLVRSSVPATIAPVSTPRASTLGDILKTLASLLGKDTPAPAAPAPAPKPPVAEAPKPAPPKPVKPANPGFPRPADGGHEIGLDTAKGQYIKDPSFANGGNPIGNKRYIAFGNLREFYLKGFSAENGKLSFGKGEVPIKIDGIPGNLDGRWAPEVQVVGDRVQLLYCAGEMHPGQGINWPSFRLRSASMPLSEFQKQAESGKPVTFKDQGAMFQDQATFGGDRDFAMIDPQFWTNPDGKAFMSYTVVKHGIPGKRAHEEFVRYREVDPKNPARAIGPDMPLVDGWSRGTHAGVAEAQDIVTINGQPFVFISSKAGDIDQKVLAAPIGNNLGKIEDAQLKPVLGPGGAPWKSNAVGSTSTVVIDGQPYMLHQGMGKDKHFHLGWTKLDM